MADEMKTVTWGELAEGHEAAYAEIMLPYNIQFDGVIYDRIVFVKVDGVPHSVLTRIDNDEYVCLGLSETKRYHRPKEGKLMEDIHG